VYFEQARRQRGSTDPERAREAQNLAFKAMYLFEQLGLDDAGHSCEALLRELKAPSWLTMQRAERAGHGISTQTQDIARAHGSSPSTSARWSSSGRPRSCSPRRPGC